MVTKLSDKSKWEHWHFDISGVWICWTYLFRVADIPFPSISRISRSFELRPIRGTGKASSSSQCQRGAPSGDVARASEWRRKICWRLWTYLCLLLYILLYYIHNNIICYSILYIWYSILYTWYSIIHTLHIYIYIHTYYSMHIYIYILNIPCGFKQVWFSSLFGMITTESGLVPLWAVSNIFCVVSPWAKSHPTNIANWKITTFFMGKSTISTGPFSICKRLPEGN